MAGDPCLNPCIPGRLHTNGRANIQVFAVGDVVYRRSKNAAKDSSVFKDLKLSDISLNRATIGTETISAPNDVLLNIHATTQEDCLFAEHIIELTVREIDKGKNTYYKLLPEKTEILADGTTASHWLSLELQHDCIPCNYAHSVIAVTYNGQVLSPENYEDLFGKKKNRLVKELRNEARNEIAKMITYEELWVNGPYE